ncbi:Dehydroquinase [Aspergillus novofumigatus IBT 16806]|uniref:Catabolic 3-dehydroquinase n=1 Tax=Aspergillus novofumigatus (strain IBT 16806) TaxID=1392255 RepID=A0A2I1BYN4_ASPN1|nr:Dehydroquinase [Aspergillus novofumigatus IBT 16806]PKX90483.1 Dehydroquinase [Aspergillus novofumigatus IBT 16806]
MPSILLINGSNLNLLGTREPHLYGSTTLPQPEDNAKALAASKARGHTDAIIVNPGAFTHTGVAIRDALFGVSIPFVEVHITNAHAREESRRHSYLSDKAAACIIGLGSYGYEAAIEYAVREIISAKYVY